MAHYFFQVWDRSGLIEDPDGVELCDDAAIRRTAVIAARSLICDDVQHGVLDLRGRIEVVDGAGVTVFTLHFNEALEPLG